MFCSSHFAAQKALKKWSITSFHSYSLCFKTYKLMGAGWEGSLTTGRIPWRNYSSNMRCHSWMCPWELNGNTAVRAVQGWSPSLCHVSGLSWHLSTLGWEKWPPICTGVGESQDGFWIPWKTQFFFFFMTNPREWSWVLAGSTLEKPKLRLWQRVSTLSEKWSFLVNWEGGRAMEGHPRDSMSHARWHQSS